MALRALLHGKWVGCLVGLAIFGVACQEKKVEQVGTIADYLSERKIANAEEVLLKPQEDLNVEAFCARLNKRFKRYRWKKIHCDASKWKVGGRSVQNQPLLYAEFGDLKAPKVKTTLVLCGVHGDELTTIHLCFSMSEMELLTQPERLKGKKVVIAPLVNPDGFFKKPKPTRSNANGVDLNRNFATRDWERLAHKEWSKKYWRDKRKFPGDRPNSEPETIFQIALMDFYHPDKILSAHAPLRFIDYDGPADQTHYGLERREHRARYLAMNISKNSRFPLVDYKFYPGSLGNYAGQDKGIPTYTIELPTTRPSRAKWVWKRFEYSLVKAVSFDVTDKKVEEQMTTQAEH